MDSISTPGNVPSMKPETPPPDPAMAPPEPSGAATATASESAAWTAVAPPLLDKDYLCPICMQTIKDAFLTGCGHSYCYLCIITHLKNKSDCPCCGHYLTASQLYPNFLLDKLLKKNSARQVSKSASPVEQFRQVLQQGSDVSIKELDSLLSLLTDMKKKVLQEQSEKNMQILLDFLLCLKKKKADELNEVQKDLQYIKEDKSALERHKLELYQLRDKYSLKVRMLGDDNPTTRKPWSSLVDRNNSGFTFNSYNAQGSMSFGSFDDKKVNAKAPMISHGLSRRDILIGAESQNVNQSSLLAARKKRIHTMFNDLQECYLQKRRQMTDQSHEEEGDQSLIHREGYSAALKSFQSVLSSCTRYSRMRVIAELRQTDIFHTANIVSSIEFDRDDELFATAGVSRRIKVFDFTAVVNESADINCPIVEMATRSKLSCLSWNKCTKNHIASSDYEGIVTVWDINTRQSVMEYEEHEKRAWSVDFSRTEPSMLVSGSDDCKVKVWCTKQEASVINIDMRANICCVKYNPGSSNYIAVGSADHHIHYFDLRNTSQPLHVSSGHKKAVSYVKFLSENELASASTDSTLRLWDVRENLPIRTYRGHTNEKNFVGLSVNRDFIACGSETNDVFVYHKEISKPVTWHKFGSPSPEDIDDETGSYFISAVCWKSDNPTVLAANSQGTIKVLVLAA